MSTAADRSAALEGSSSPIAAKLRLFRTRLLAWLDDVRQSETHLSLLLSLLIGALVGLVVVAFLLLTGRLAARMYPPDGGGWRRILVPVIGSGISGFLLYRYFPQARGSGIPQTKAALFLRDGMIDLRTVLGKFSCCAVSLASGIALGREGPSVHIGGGLASVMAQRLGLDRRRIKEMVPVGCSAALAAAFNTPIAAVLFSLEEIMGNLHAPVLGGVVIGSATSWMILHLIMGDDPLFHVPGYTLVHPAEFAVYALLGALGGVVSAIFVRMLLALRVQFRKLPAKSVWIQPAIGGLAVGLIGYFVPEVLGAGYGYVERVLNGDVAIATVLLLLVLKIPATAVCYSSGNAGGIFGPSLFLGAMLGAAVGYTVHGFFPQYTGDPGAYALIGMGAAFAGIIRTPMTSVIMIFELTRDYTIIVPLMIANMTSYFISQRMQREQVYEALAHQDGVHLPAPEHETRQVRGRVADAMRPLPELPTPAHTAAETRALAVAAKLDFVPVVSRGVLRGVVAVAKLEEMIAGGQPDVTMEASGLLTDGSDGPSFAHLHADHSLSRALDRMGSAGTRSLPVVSRTDARRLEGIAYAADLLKSLGLRETTR